MQTLCPHNCVSWRDQNRSIDSCVSRQRTYIRPALACIGPSSTFALLTTCAGSAVVVHRQYATVNTAVCLFPCCRCSCLLLIGGVCWRQTCNKHLASLWRTAMSDCTCQRAYRCVVHSLQHAMRKNVQASPPHANQHSHQSTPPPNSSTHEHTPRKCLCGPAFHVCRFWWWNRQPTYQQHWRSCAAVCRTQLLQSTWSGGQILAGGPQPQ
jgi:hypothetical protein